jgi:DNA polymerase-3 subunit alpha
MELERIKKTIEMSPVIVEEEIVSTDDGEEVSEMELDIPVEKEEIVVKTKLSMPSRKLKVKISSELLQELDKMQVSFKLN